MNGQPLTIGASSVAAPQLDHDSTTALAEAIETLRLLRGGELYNSADQLTVLASIAAAAQQAIPDAIADAVEDGHTWEQIAHCSGLSISATRRQHAQAEPKERPHLD